jgi:EAL domain-containing protein (putative c-di-GMP-specific phosphodiesterase class I)
VRLAPGFIKVDMSTIRDISAHPPRLALVSSSLGFAADIGATVVADGVETGPENRDAGGNDPQGLQGLFNGVAG